MLLRPREKIDIVRRPRLFHGRPNSAACFRDLLVSFTVRASFEIVETISGKNEMRVRIDEGGQYNFAFGIDDFRFPCLLLDLLTRTDDIDLAVANQHPAVANDSQVRSGNGDQLGSVKNSERLQD